MRAKAIIFDWDGVIADSLPVQFEIYRKIEKEIGKQIFPKNPSGDHFQMDWRNHFWDINIRDKKTLNQAIVIYEKEMKKLEHKITLYPGIKKVLEKLSKNYKLGIVSNNYSSHIERKMWDWGIRHCFSVIMDGKSSTIKPDPGQILECMRKLKVKPEETIYIGDMDGDVLAGRNAKVKMVVAVTYGFHSEKKFKNLDPDIVFNSPKELLGLAKY